MEPLVHESDALLTALRGPALNSAFDGKAYFSVEFSVCKNKNHCYLC